MKIDQNIREFKTWEFNQIKMGYAITSYTSLNEIFHAKSNEDTVRLHFGISGDYAFEHLQLKETFDLVGGHHNIMYSNGLDMRIENKSKEIKTFGVQFPKIVFLELMQSEDPLVRDFCQRVLKGESAIISAQWGNITSPIQKIIHEMINNCYNGVLQNIFLYAKTLELLVLCIDNYKKNSKRKYNYIKTNADKEAILKARDFINARISAPPGISEIAQAVGINEFKLKYGFKEMFGSTLFAYLTSTRLDYATQLLTSTSQPISTISESLGYKSPQHFSNQYKSKIGKAPSEVRKN